MRKMNSFALEEVYALPKKEISLGEVSCGCGGKGVDDADGVFIRVHMGSRFVVVFVVVEECQYGINGTSSLWDSTEGGALI